MEQLIVPAEKRIRPPIIELSAVRITCVFHQSCLATAQIDTSNLDTRACHGLLQLQTRRRQCVKGTFGWHERRGWQGNTCDIHANVCQGAHGSGCHARRVSLPGAHMGPR
eukprot:5657254-Pyramimonas_sp.AAC.1